MRTPVSSSGAPKASQNPRMNSSSLIWSVILLVSVVFWQPNRPSDCRAAVSELSLEQQLLDYAAAANLAARSDTKLRGKRPRLVYQDAWQDAGTSASASDL